MCVRVCGWVTETETVHNNIRMDSLTIARDLLLTYGRLCGESNTLGCFCFVNAVRAHGREKNKLRLVCKRIQNYHFYSQFCSLFGENRAQILRFWRISSHTQMWFAINRVIRVSFFFLLGCLLHPNFLHLFGTPAKFLSRPDDSTHMHRVLLWDLLSFDCVKKTVICARQWIK